MGITEIPKTELIERAAKELLKNPAFQPPQWAMFCKTGTFKERQPINDDWWSVRAAAILRRLSDTDGPIGVQKLRTLYGGKKNRGHKPERYYPGSGSIIRKILQQLDKAGFARKIEKGAHKGRAITPQGLSFLGKIADAYMKENNILLPKKPAGELNIIEPPREKKPRAPRVRKKVEATEAGAPTAETAGVPAAEAPKPARKRAPRKKAETAAPAAPEAAPAPTAQAQSAPEAPKTE